MNGGTVLNYSLERLPTDGILGETKPDYLVEYGILNERSDYRAHVCVLAETVYVFPTRSAIKAIQSGKYDGKPAYQPGYNKPTAWGFPVPVRDLERVIPLWAKVTIQAAAFCEDDSTSVKGDKAVKVVAALLKAGWFPLPVNPKIISDAEMQITGLDIYVRAECRIQVKCDYKGGVGRSCTGNLYLQTAEINPFKRV